MVKRRRMAGQTPRGRGVTCLSLDEQGEERSAALPSGLGTAALLGVLASYLADTLRNYWWRAFFGADPPRNIGSGFRANLSGSWFLVLGSCNLSALRRWSLDSNSKYPCLKCRALAKQHRRKLCIFLSFRRPPKRLIASTRETVPSRNTASPANVRCKGLPCR